LGHCSDDNAYNTLITLLRDPEVSVRINAAGALKAMGRTSAGAFLRSAAQNTTDPELKAAYNDAATSLSDGENQ